jgi:hypothetical protein
MFRDTTYSTFKPYVDRAISDEDVRNNVLRAFSAARKVYGELSGADDGVVGAVKKAGTEDVRDNIDTTVQSLSDAIVRMSGKESKRSHASHWAPFLLIAVAIFVLFNPATGASTRKWVRDHLFGSEEEFDYGAPTY